jgi:hypothetical protein
MKILGLIPMLPNDFSTETAESVVKQTVPVEQVLLIFNRGVGASFPARMSNALNEGLKAVDLAEYDYLLRVDSDTVLPNNFLSSSLALNADVVGYGHAHLIRVATFLKVMNGKFNSESDDSYLNYKFQSEGYKWSYWDVKPIMSRKPGKTHSVNYFVERGEIMWKHGYEPLHVFGSVRWEPKNVLAIFGYFLALLRRKRRLDVSKFVFRFQISKLTKDARRTRRW